MTSEKAPPNGPQMCKINGETSYSLSDLYAKDGERPKFGQYYAIETTDALKDREKDYETKSLDKKLMTILEHMVRTHNVLAKMYFFASELHKQKVVEYKARYGQQPHFRKLVWKKL
uniref:Uncharacterized protein n=1 Tax=Romanomermis culicivorax TaxID=13658 RepID=A0A915KH88_ROMCU